jgi:glycyl-tRNA synthetase beta chain
VARRNTAQPKPASLLVELLTEELPPKALSLLAQCFSDEIGNGLIRYQLKQRIPNWRAFGTPRRLAVLVPEVLAAAQDRPTEISGPSTKAPAEAVAGFAKKHGIDVKALEQRETPKGLVYLARVILKGALLHTTLAEIVGEAIRKLPIPKLMRWGDGKEQFVRPVHGLMMLHGSRVVPGTVLGVKSANRTFGHRFLSGKAITLKHADDYERVLRAQGKVIAYFAGRREEIVRQLRNAARDADLVADDGMLNEVTALVEWPTVYAGQFSPDFLSVPEECLILSMQQHQRYIPLRDRKTEKLLSRFLFVSNVATKYSREIVRGNERVLRARLADAKFFFDQDRKVRLEARVPRLSSVVYHNKLGTQLERVGRIQLLAGRIARAIGADALLAERAAWLSKADLLTEMVGEFPELQGIMGSYYALGDGEPAAVARALADQYRIRYEESKAPDDLVGTCLYLADRMEALVGLFGIGEKPTGERDPFGLRRAALGIISVYEFLAAAANQSVPDVREFLEFGATLFPAGRLAETTAAEAHDFILERYWHQLAATSAKDVVEAVISRRPPVPEINARVRAVEAFRGLPEAESLAAANKRIRNILRKSEADSATLDASLLREPAERELHSSLRALTPRIAAHMDARDYTRAMKAMAALRGPVDAFFDTVLVNAEDEQLRNNRHALLRELDALMNGVADISKLAA